MKLGSLVVVLSLAMASRSTKAFVGHHAPRTPSASSSTSATRLFANSHNIRAAMEATQLYGPTSVQARLAWETVEEFDARATAGNAYEGNEANKWTEEQLAWANQEIMNTLQWIVGERTQNLAMSQDLMKDVAAHVHAIKLTPPDKKPGAQIPGLWDSKLKARAITQQFGMYSTEAKLAWEEVEEIASTGLENAVSQNAYGANNKLQECWLNQAAEACMAFEELDRFVNYEYQKHSYPQQQQQQQQDQYQYQQDQQQQQAYQHTAQGQYEQQYHQDQYQQQANQYQQQGMDYQQY